MTVEQAAPRSMPRSTHDRLWRLRRAVTGSAAAVLVAAGAGCGDNDPNQSSRAPSHRDLKPPRASDSAATVAAEHPRSVGVRRVTCFGTVSENTTPITRNSTTSGTSFMCRYVAPPAASSLVPGNDGER